MYRRFGKRVLDVVCSAFGLVLLSPVIVVTAVLVAVKLGRPILFKQLRPGKDGRLFTLYKFRTMTDAKDESGVLLADERRLTSFGKLLRSTSLDELTELWNVLKGEMSFVGPRPLRVEYLPLYSPMQRRRHEVTPGITGLAQISGRNALSWPERFAYDVRYVDSVNFKSDMAITLRTIKTVFERSDISSSTHATMQPFQGEQ